VKPRLRSRAAYLAAIATFVGVIVANPLDASARLRATASAKVGVSAPTTTSTTVPSTASCQPLPKAGGGTWQCSLDEEFNGTSLNRNLWVPITTAASGFHSGPECFVDTPNNESVANGVLTLTVRKEATPFTCHSPSGDYATQYTSEQVATYNTFSQAYGRFEVRAKVPNTPIPGLQESFWLWPDNPTKYGAWPLSGEIDFAEMYSKYNDRAIPFIHYNNGWDANETNNYCIVGDLGQWHTYAVEWTPQTITIIYDGKTCLTDSWLPMPPQIKPQPFDSPFIVALTEYLGVGTNAFQPGTTPLPASTQVDYVRVWK
jgi:beta-glucanase (GH16 family)